MQAALVGEDGLNPFRNQNSQKKGTDRQKIISGGFSVAARGGQRHQNDVAGLCICKNAAASQIGIGVKKAARKGQRKADGELFVARNRAAGTQRRGHGTTSLSGFPFIIDNRAKNASLSFFLRLQKFAGIFDIPTEKM